MGHTECEHSDKRSRVKSPIQESESQRGLPERLSKMYGQEVQRSHTSRDCTESKAKINIWSKGHMNEDGSKGVITEVE